MNTVDLYPYLIIIGGSILFASARMLHHYRTQSRRGQELIRLNEKLQYDLPDFLRDCWPILSEGRFVGLSWELNWFGTTISNSDGISEGSVIEKQFSVQDIFVKVCLYHRQKGWDQQHFTETLAENFFLLVQMNMWIKIGSTERAFDQAAKVNVFLQHDVKNMIQLLNLMIDHHKTDVEGNEKDLLDSVRQTIPAIRNRAQHMLNSLTEKTASPCYTGPEKRRLRLDELMNATAKVYDLDISVNGQASVAIGREHLQSIVDNLLGNYSYQSRKNDGLDVDLNVRIEIESNQVIAHLFDQNGSPCLWPERLFEPFWSELGAGRGIGLYQAKHHAEAVGGSLVVTSAADKPLCFILRLPKQALQL